MVGVDKIASVVIYLSAWTQMMWYGCTYSRANFEQCVTNWDIWLLPELIKGYEMLTKPCPYCEEQDAIQSRGDLQTD